MQTGARLGIFPDVYLGMVETMSKSNCPHCGKHLGEGPRPKLLSSSVNAEVQCVCGEVTVVAGRKSDETVHSKCASCGANILLRWRCTPFVFKYVEPSSKCDHEAKEKEG
jgi:hypothetical protein